MSANPVVVEAWRGPVVESRHRGAIAICDPHGALVANFGDVTRPVLPRSAIKLLQALPLVATGAADRFSLDEACLAITCASHSGEPDHVATVARLLAAAGVAEGDLACGAHPPMHEPSARALLLAAGPPTALHNNCSGKHAGFLALGRHLGLDPRGYVASDHPVMRTITAALAATTGVDVATAPCGIDGCSIPTYALPLTAIATGLARAATGIGLPTDLGQAATRLRQAIAANPRMIAGTGRFDTRIADQFGLRACVKVGAEGVYALALPTVGLGVALKIDDGTSARAAEVVAAELLRRVLDPLSGDDAALLAALAAPTLRNWQGLEVGALRVAPALADWAWPGQHAH